MPTARGSSACANKTFSPNVSGRPSRSCAIEMLDANFAYVASTSRGGVVGPTGSNMLARSSPERELDLEGRAIGGVAVLRIEHGVSVHGVGDAAHEQQRVAGRTREEMGGGVVGNLGRDRLLDRIELDP